MTAPRPATSVRGARSATADRPAVTGRTPLAERAALPARTAPAGRAALTDRTALIGRAALAASAVIASLALTACGGSGAAPAADSHQHASPAAAAAPAAAADTKRFELRFAGGKVEGGLARLDVPLGSTVELVVTGDQPDEAHLHGYDKAVDVVPGVPATIRFVADKPGAYEFELHKGGFQLARLEVS